MSRREPDGSRALHLPFYLLVLIIISSLSTMAFSVSLILSNNNTTISRIVKNFWPGNRSSESPPSAAAAAKAYASSPPTLPPANKNDAFSREVTAQLETLHRQMNAMDLNFWLISQRVRNLEESRPEIDLFGAIGGIAAFVASVLAIGASIMKIGDAISKWRRRRTI